MNPVEFKVLETFHCEENGNTYVKDMWYTLRPGNEQLAYLLFGWMQKGLVKIGATESKISGSGKIE